MGAAQTGAQAPAGSQAESFGHAESFSQSTIGEQPSTGRSAADQPSTSQPSTSGTPIGQTPAREPSAGYQAGSASGQQALGQQALGQQSVGQPRSGQADIGQPAAGQPAVGQSTASAPAPPVSPGSGAWQAAAQPLGSAAASTAEQPGSGVSRPLGGTATTASAPWLAGTQSSGTAPADGGQTPATLETGKQPLIIPASSDAPWIEQPDEAATVAWVPPAATKGPTDTPWAEPDVYRSEIEMVKPPDELGGPVSTGIICSACGTENETTRRFCRSCGNPFFAIERPAPEVEEPKRRSWRWLAILLPILLVAGLLGFGGAALIRGGLFGSASPGPGTPPTTSGGGGVQLAPSGATASSRLGDIWEPRMAIDGDPTTSWREKGGLAGQWIQVSFKQPVTILSITIWAGAQKDQDAYKGNLRPRHITVAADGGQGQSFELSDTFGAQELAYKGPVTSLLKITIQDAYPSTKTSYPQSPTQDCAISELQFNGTRP